MQERQEKALRIVFTDELPDLVGDLPEASQLDSLATPAPTAAPAPIPTFAHDPLPAEHMSVTIMSGKDITLPPGTRSVSNFAWWGGNNYYLTEAMGPGRIVTMQLHAVMAGHDIYVPRGVRVLDQSTAIMAGADIEKDAQGDGSNGTLVLTGVLFWAGHSVKLAKD